MKPERLSFRSVSKMRLKSKDCARVMVFEISEINNNGVSSVLDGGQNPYQYFHLTTHT